METGSSGSLGAFILIICKLSIKQIRQKKQFPIEKTPQIITNKICINPEAELCEYT